MLKLGIYESPVIQYTKFQCAYQTYTKIQCFNIPNSSTKIRRIPVYESPVLQYTKFQCIRKSASPLDSFLNKLCFNIPFPLAKSYICLRNRRSKLVNNRWATKIALLGVSRDEKIRESSPSTISTVINHSMAWGLPAKNGHPKPATFNNELINSRLF